VNTDTVKITLSTPADIIAAVPHLLGFAPADSLVVLALTGPRLLAAIRYDLPAPADTAILTEHLISCLAANRADEVVLLGYGPASQVTPILRAAREALAGLLTICDTIRMTAGRWWSLDCPSALCCPPEGSPCDSDMTVAAAEFAVLGSAPLPSRDGIAATITPVSGHAAKSMRAAVHAATRDLLPGLDDAEPPAESFAAISQLLAMPVPLPDRDAARLLVLLTCIRLRDQAWVITDGGDPQTQVQFWSDLTRRAPGRHAAPPASLLAYAAACMTGNGVLARAAAERALSAAPGYSLALLLLEMLDSGAPAPRLRLGLTTGDLDELYGRRTRQA
jgi:Domain of unknown function (DUF4192)